jgi:hypothetical protein
MPPLSPVASSLSPNHSQDGAFYLDLQQPRRSTATSPGISSLLAQDCLTRLCLITLRSTFDPFLLRTALQLRWQSAVGTGALCPMRARSLDERQGAGSEAPGQQANA